MTQQLLLQTKLLNYEHNAIQSLITEREWKLLSEYKRIGAAYTFVRDEIYFGYNYSDDIAASQVLADGYGQCNTKGTLLMALLRALGIPSRLHGFTIEQALQKGAIPSIFMYLAPNRILHSWVEIFHGERWVNLEGFILDKPYLAAIQAKFNNPQGDFCGYGIATQCIQRPDIDWNGSDTYIQKEGVADDFGLFSTPDEFYSTHGTNLIGIRRWLYQRIIRHIINWNVQRLRNN